MKLIFEKISKNYGKNRALNAFSAELENGIYALLGPNGSGKTTLLNIITGNLKSDSGSIIFEDDNHSSENIVTMGVRFREQIGFMPQYTGFYPNFTVEDLMMYIAALKGIKKDRAGEQTADLLDKVELADVRRNRIRTLSGGMKQRLALAQAMLGDPRILILDEPTAGLDPKQRISIRNYISEMAFDRIVIIATHIVSDIEYSAKKVIMLKKGEISDCGSPDELIGKMAGFVWIIPCEEQEVPELTKKYSVVNIGKREKNGQSELRVISETKPSQNSYNVSPSLEDYYLYVFGEK